MKSISWPAIIAFSLVFALALPIVASDDLPEPLRALRNAPSDQRAEILVLGTFHFKDAGRDSYKPQHDIDIFSAERQAELEEILSRLQDFEPTKIAVEVDYSRRTYLDSSYAAYLNGEKQLTSNEIHQIGFRLARQLGHDRVYAVDAPSEGYFSTEAHQQWVERLAEGEKHGLDSEVWEARFNELYTHDDSSKVDHRLREIFLYMNSQERLYAGHGHYLIGKFQISTGEDYIGPDAMAGWYMRNLRIFHNLIRITDSPDERILLIIGAGHAPILTHAIDASPQYRLVPVDVVLGD